LDQNITSIAVTLKIEYILSKFALNPHTRNVMRYLFFFLTLIFLFNNCSSVEESQDNPELLYEQAEKNIKADKYQLALDKLRVLRNKFPYSRFSQLAQLKMADVYFLQEAYAEAAASYELFRELHPKHEQAPYALFRSGESYFKATPSTISRDLTYGQKAVDSLELFIKTYPGNENKENAEKLLSEMKDRLAEKEFRIANYYQKKNIFGAAERRYRKIINQFPKSKFAKTAQIRLKTIEEKSE